MQRLRAETPLPARGSLPRAARSTLLLSACALILAGCNGGGSREGCDVLLISLDSVRADALTFVDEQRTPNLARLARRGVVFDQALSGTSWTLPAHAQMFTGLPPQLSGVQTHDIRIDPRTHTLPELLSARGYRTLGSWSGWFLVGDYGFARGFDSYASAMDKGLEADRDFREASRLGNEQAAMRKSLEREFLNHQDVTSKRLAEILIHGLEGVDADRNVFLFAHLFDPHYDYLPPAPFDRKFDPDYAGTIDGRDYWRNPRIWDPSKDPPRRISERDLEHVRALYHGELAWVDQQLGRLFDALEAEGRLDETLIVVTADHGEEFFEHENRGHRQTLYDEVLRVPLLIVPPASMASGRVAGDGPRRVGSQVTLSDLLPTIADYTGAELPRGVWGRSLRPLVEGSGPIPERPALSILTQARAPTAGPREYRVTEALRTPSSKLVRRFMMRPGREPELEFVALYDLERDPAEQHPLIDPTLADPRLVAGWNQLEAQAEHLRRAFALLPHSPPEERATRIRESFESELAGLGYAEGIEDVAGRTPESWLLQPLPPLRLP